MYSKCFICPIFVLALSIMPACRIELTGYEELLIKETIPASEKGVLDGNTYPGIRFIDGIDKASAEKIFSVESGGIAVDGSKRWQESLLSFIPSESLKAGRYYYLKLNGNLRDSRGQEYPVFLSLPFQCSPPEEGLTEIVSWTPPSGDTLTSPEQSIEIKFSKPVRGSVFEYALFFSPAISAVFSWNESGDTCSITPKMGWKNQQIYSASLLSDVDISTDASGSPELKSPVVYHSNFIDITPISAAVSVVQIDWRSSFPAVHPGDLSVYPGETFQISFSRPVPKEEVEAHFQIFPFCRGSFFWKNDSQTVFIPDDGFQEGETYTLSLPDSVAQLPPDSAVESPPLFPSVIRVRGEAVDNFPDSLSPLPTESIGISPIGPQGAYTFFFTFDAGIPDPYDRQRIQEGCKIEPLFPSDIPSPPVVSFLWIDHENLMLQTEEIGASHQGRSCFYRLVLPDGGGEIRNLYLRYDP